MTDSELNRMSGDEALAALGTDVRLGLSEARLARGCSVTSLSSVGRGIGHEPDIRAKSGPRQARAPAAVTLDPKASNRAPLF
jgi:hypothetical protein